MHFLDILMEKCNFGFKLSYNEDVRTYGSVEKYFNVFGNLVILNIDEEIKNKIIYKNQMFKLCVSLNNAEQFVALYSFYHYDIFDLFDTVKDFLKLQDSYDYQMEDYLKFVKLFPGDVILYGNPNRVYYQSSKQYLKNLEDKNSLRLNQNYGYNNKSVVTKMIEKDKIYEMNFHPNFDVPNEKHCVFHYNFDTLLENCFDIIGVVDC